MTVAMNPESTDPPRAKNPRVPAWLAVPIWLVVVASGVLLWNWITGRGTSVSDVAFGTTLAVVAFLIGRLHRWFRP